MEQLRFGSITVDVLSDGMIRHELPPLFPDADVEAFRALGGVDAAGNIEFPLTSFAIRSGGKLVLVDTGLGPELGPLGRAGYTGEVGTLPQRMRAAGIAAEDVDTVVFTHLHIDHIGWNLDEAEARIMFPRARYVASKPEWAFWGGSTSKVIGRLVRPLEAAGQLVTVDDGHVVAPGVELMLTPGHTPGHVCVVVVSEGEGALITGDAAHHPLEIEKPSQLTSMDSDPQLAVASRERLIERAEAEGLQFLGGHFPAPHLGRLVMVGAKRRWKWSGA